LLEFDPGEGIYAQGQKDDFVNYLLHGRVARAVDGVTLDALDAEKDERNRPLDASAVKRDTVHALSTATVLRLHRRELNRVYREIRGEDAGGTLEVTDIASDNSRDWWTRLLRSEVFARLSASAMQAIFDRLEEVSVLAGEEVIRQGQSGEYYYVVQTGRCEVVRRASSGYPEVHLADLDVGEGFGEEALIAQAPRNATVRMLTDGTLMRLAKADFMTLVVERLVNGVSLNQGRWLAEQGAKWIDVRGFESRGSQLLAGATKMPLHLLRLQSRRLDKDTIYVVCGDTVRMGLLAAFLLVERGFDACYLEPPLPEVDTVTGVGKTAPTDVDMISETGHMTEHKQRASVVVRPGEGTAGGIEPGSGIGNDAAPSDAAAHDERVAREAFADTTTGEELADLIDELYRQRDGFGEVGDAGPGAQDAAPERATPPTLAPAAEATTGPGTLLPAPSAVTDIAPGASTSEIVGEILSDVEKNLSGYLAQFIEAQRGVLEQRVEQRLAALERAALERVQAEEGMLRTRFEQAFADKEKSLAEAYDRLTSLANRISHQKADIQQARKELESMLRTASRVHREVYRVGNALVDQFDHLDDFADDMKLS